LTSAIFPLTKMHSVPSSSQISYAARDAIKSLKDIGVESCFVGGMACQLYGHSRKPNDLDIFVLSSHWSQEQLKRRLVEVNPRFYLVDARNPTATYKVLWYRVSGTQPSSSFTRSTHFRTYSLTSLTEVKLKVDILLPGTMDIPLFPSEKITWNTGLPSAPFILVLLLKLQAWFHHRHSSEARFREKQFADHNNLQALLAIACSKNVRILPQAPSEAYLPQDFLMNSVARVAEHIRIYPRCKNDWGQLGFGATPSTSSGTSSRILSPARPLIGQPRTAAASSTATPAILFQFRNSGNIA